MEEEDRVEINEDANIFKCILKNYMYYRVLGSKINCKKLLIVTNHKLHYTFKATFFYLYFARWLPLRRGRQLKIVQRLIGNDKSPMADRFGADYFSFTG
jgi:hypothetical protein